MGRVTAPTNMHHDKATYHNDSNRVVTVMITSLNSDSEPALYRGKACVNISNLGYKHTLLQRMPWQQQCLKPALTSLTPGIYETTKETSGLSSKVFMNMTSLKLQVWL